MASWWDGDGITWFILVGWGWDYLVRLGGMGMGLPGASCCSSERSWKKNVSVCSACAEFGIWDGDGDGDRRWRWARGRGVREMVVWHGLSIHRQVGSGISDEQGSVEQGSVERGSVERGSVERGSMERGSVERGSMERGSMERGSVERGWCGRGWCTDRWS